MKMRIISLTIFAFTLTLLFVGCTKDNNTTDYTSEVSAHSDDQSRFSGEVDAVANDADVMLETTAGFTGRVVQVQLLSCDATAIIDTLSNPRTITITYNGTNCLGNRTRTGVVILSMAQGMRWRNAGAVINVTYQNLRITRISDNKSITINGTSSYTNVSGGLLINLPTLNTILHTITSSGMSITFDSGAQRNWQVAKQRVFTYNNGVVITTTGTHSSGSATGIAEWGTNRFGNAFTSAISQPLIVRQDCNFRLTGGQIIHDGSHFTATATFGLDANGNATNCPGSGNYYMKIVWTGPGGNAHSVILPY